MLYALLPYSGISHTPIYIHSMLTLLQLHYTTSTDTYMILTVYYPTIYAIQLHAYTANNRSQVRSYMHPIHTWLGQFYLSGLTLIPTPSLHSFTHLYTYIDLQLALHIHYCYIHHIRKISCYMCPFINLYQVLYITSTRFIQIPPHTSQCFIPHIQLAVFHTHFPIRIHPFLSYS